MSRTTIRPTATRPYTESLSVEGMSPIATKADIEVNTATIATNATDLVSANARIDDLVTATSTLSGETQVDSTAADLAALIVDFNALLDKLRTAKVLATA